MHGDGRSEVKTSPSVCKENLPSQRATAKLTVPEARSPREVFGTAPPLFLHPPLRHRPLTGSHGARRSQRRSPSRCAALHAARTSGTFQKRRDAGAGPPRRASRGAQRALRDRTGLPGPAHHFRLQEQLSNSAGPARRLSPLGKGGERRLRLDNQEPIAVSAMRMRIMLSIY